MGPVSVRWVATQNNGLSGPFTMTYNNVSIQASLSGSFSGGTNNPGELRVQIQLAAGASSAFPSCSILAGPVVVSGFPVGATSFTSSAFDINYNSCQGFIAPTGITNGTTESTVLKLTKQ